MLLVFGIWYDISLFVLVFILIYITYYICVTVLFIF
jgi:hypothetical protein